MEGTEERPGGQEGNATRDCGELVQIQVLEMQRGGWHSRGAVTGRRARRKEGIRDVGFLPRCFRQDRHSRLRSTSEWCGWGREQHREIETSLSGKCWGYWEIPRGGTWQTQ